MPSVDIQQFEQLVKQAVDAIPQKFKTKMNNVNFFVEDFPNAEQISKMRLRHKYSLLGLYEGVPIGKRGSYPALPDSITIFRIPLLSISTDLKDLEQKVKDTVWHEVGHHFGMNEFEVRIMEAKRNKKREKKLGCP